MRNRQGLCWLLVASVYWSSASSLLSVVFPSVLRAQTLVYSFESDLEGFAPNGFPGTPVLSQDSIGATEGSQALKIVAPSSGTFVGALTQIVPGILNPPGIGHVLFDLTITEPFGPPPPAPAGFAVIGVTMYGHGGGQFGLQAQFSDTEHVDGKEPGTYRDVRIDLDESAGPYRAGDSFNDIFCTGEVCDEDDLLPSGFQFFINKTDIHPLTVFIDNVRVVPASESLQGDYNANGSVDAADYVLWRNGGPLENEVADPGDISPADYTEWRARFGNALPGGAGSNVAVPEPATAFLMFGAGACLLSIRRGAAAR